jgi:hypothetical protein
MNRMTVKERIRKGDGMKSSGIKESNVQEGREGER